MEGVGARECLTTKPERLQANGTCRSARAPLLRRRRQCRSPSPRREARRAVVLGARCTRAQCRGGRRGGGGGGGTWRGEGRARGRGAHWGCDLQAPQGALRHPPLHDDFAVLVPVARAAPQPTRGVRVQHEGLVALLQAQLAVTSSLDSSQCQSEGARLNILRFAVSNGLADALQFFRQGGNQVQALVHPQVQTFLLSTLLAGSCSEDLQLRSLLCHAIQGLGSQREKFQGTRA
mmetsp:Transcript_15504/g.54333  ORF Transcript_15504/g.54333 Transcript_15504/m.54333 type:complete len:234 (-) Transcript_15504:824-1525(-)